MVWTGNSNPVPSVAQAEITSDTFAIAATSTRVTLVAPSSQIIVFNNSGQTVYINLRNTTASSSNLAIPTGSTFTYTGAQIAAFTLISASGTVNVGVLAN